MDITELLAFSVKNKASDLHLSAGLPPMIRVHGDIRRINLPAMEHKEVHGLVYDIMNDAQRKFYEENKEVDFSFEVPGLARFRVNAFVHNRGAGAVMRTIPSKILSLEELKAPKSFESISDFPRGLVLVTGPTGSGKTTTLYSTLKTLATPEVNVCTIEDPIEMVEGSFNQMQAAQENLDKIEVEGAASTYPDHDVSPAFARQASALPDELHRRFARDGQDDHRQACLSEQLEERGVARRVPADDDESTFSQRTRGGGRLGRGAAAEHDAAGRGEFEGEP